MPINEVKNVAIAVRAVTLIPIFSSISNRTIPIVIPSVKVNKDIKKKFNGMIFLENNKSINVTMFSIKAGQNILLINSDETSKSS